MNKNEYYKLNSDVELMDLKDFNLFRKLSDSGGRYSYVQFHRKNAPFGSSVPSQIYIHPDDVEKLLKKIPKATIFQKKLPGGKIAFMLMTNLYEKKILDNSSLDQRAVIELTVHCLNESLRFLRVNTISINDLNDSLRKISSNLVLFMDRLLISAEAREYLLNEIFYRNKNNLPHAIRVCMYTCDTLAVISSEKSINFEPGLVANTLWGILIHNNKFWADLPDNKLVKSRAGWPDEVVELCEHLNKAHDKDYRDSTPVAPILRIASITDAFDELTACIHNVYVFSPSDAFTYLKERMTDNHYTPYLASFIRAFENTVTQETALQVG